MATSLSPAVLKTQINTTLTRLGSTTTSAYACGEYHAALPNPGLDITGLGCVGLPLSDRDAHAIIARCKKSAFGKGEHTLVDDSVRRCWELDHDQLALRNPRWEAGIRGLIPQLHKKLCLACPAQHVRAELYKLLVYEEGAFFKPHKDSEKVPGMFGTLVIALPSPHQGGDLVLRHQSTTFDFKTSVTSDFDFSWSAWYADVLHEVLPVTKGIRLVLTYNLVVHPSRAATIPTAPSDMANHELLCQAFREWSSSIYAERKTKRAVRNLPTFLVHNLSHEYTLASLSLDNLKGNDRAHVDALKLAADATSSTLLLGTAELHIEKDEEYDDDVEIERTTTLQSLRTLQGTSIGSLETVCEDENALTRLIFDEDSPDDEEHEGHTGNEGAPASFWYRKGVCILIPEAAADIFMFQGPNRWEWATAKIGSLLSSISEQAAHGVRIARLSQHILEQSKTPSSIFDLPSSAAYYSTKANAKPNAAQLACYTQIALAALEIQDMALFDDAVKWNRRVLSSQCFRKMGSLIARSNQDHLLSKIITGLSRLPLVPSRFEMTQHVLSGFDEVAAEDPKSIGMMDRGLVAHECFEAVLNAPGEFSKEDGIVIARMVASLPLEAEPSRTQLVDKLLNKSVAALIGFGLQWWAQASTPREGSNHQILLRVLNIIWSQFESSSLCAKLVSDIDRVASESARLVTGDDLRQLLAITKELQSSGVGHDQAVLIFGYDEQQICDKMLGACASADVYDLLAMWLDFVGLVVAKKVPYFLTANGGPSETAAQICQKTVQLYATLYIGKKPVYPTDWVKAKRGTCNCADCGLVNAFLASPTEDTAGFRFAQRRRDHLDHIFKDPLPGSYKHHLGTRVWQSLDYSIQTIRTGSPHTWQITKSHGAFDEQLSQWNKRVTASKLTFQKMGHVDPLAAFVGTDMSRAILKNEWEKLYISVSIEQQRSAVGGREQGKGASLTSRAPLVPSTGALNSKRLIPAGGFGTAQPAKRLASGSFGPARTSSVIDLTDDTED